MTYDEPLLTTMAQADNPERIKELLEFAKCGATLHSKIYAVVKSQNIFECFNFELQNIKTA